MSYDNEIYRRPYRRGDYHLVNTTRAGTYWLSPEGIVVQMASAEPERTTLRARRPARTFAAILPADGWAGG